MNEEVIKKFNLAPTTEHIGESFVRGITIYMDENCNRYMACDENGFASEDWKIMIMKRPNVGVWRRSWFTVEYLLSDLATLDYINTEMSMF